MRGRRFASVGAALVVAAIAAVASYAHMRGLATHYGQPEALADLLPLSVDGMLVVASIALGDGRRRRWSAWLAFWIGVTASVVANVLAAQPSTVARCISAWPAIAFLLVVEIITRAGRGTSPADTGHAAPATASTPPAPAGRGRALPEQPATDRTPVPELTGCPVEPPATPDSDRPAIPATGQPATTADKVAAARAGDPTATQAAIAEQLSISERTVRRYDPASPANQTRTKELAATP